LHPFSLQILITDPGGAFDLIVFPAFSSCKFVGLWGQQNRFKSTASDKNTLTLQENGQIAAAIVQLTH